MTGQDLKNSILQLAIQGKLVPQDANDEPASVLLERIKAEKQKLIKEKKIKKEKPLPEITEEEKPFEIPESWEWCRFGEITSLITDGTHNRPTYVEKGVPFLSVKDISSGKILFDDCKFISQEDHTILSSRCNPQYGDLLITKVGSNTGIPVLVDTDAEFSLFVSVALIKFVKYTIFDKFIKYLINSPLVQSQIKERTRGVGNPNWVLKDISETFIPLPPLSEQHRIVAKIEELMPLVEEYDKAQKELDALNAKLPEALKKSILQEAIQGKLVPQDPNDEPASVLLQRIRKEKEQLVKDGKLKKKDLVTTPITDEEKPFEIPENWEWCRMRDLCNFATPNKKDAQLVCLDARYLRGKGEGTIMSRGNYVDKGQYIILVDGENSGEVFITPCKGFLGSTFKELLITEEINFDFLKYIFLIIKEELRQNKRGAAIPHLDKVLFFEHLIPLPPLAEQHRIVSKIEDLFAQIEPLAKALSTPM